MPKNKRPRKKYNPRKLENLAQKQKKAKVRFMMQLLAELTEAGFIYEAPEDNMLVAYESEDIMQEFSERSDELMDEFGDKYQEVLEDIGHLKYTKLNQVYYFELEDDFLIHPGEVVNFIGKSETALEKFAQLMEQQNRKAKALV